MFNILIYHEYILFAGEQGINPSGLAYELRKLSQKCSYIFNNSSHVFSKTSKIYTI